MTTYDEATITVKVSDAADLLTLAAGGVMLDQLMQGTTSEACGQAFSDIAEALDDLVLNEVDPTTIPFDVRVVFEARARVRAGEDEAVVNEWQEAQYATNPVDDHAPFEIVDVVEFTEDDLAE